MASSDTRIWEGGCLCGETRYSSGQAPLWTSYCHCGMCRKATGAPYTGFVEFAAENLQWTRKPAQVFASTPGVSRRFCGKCGTSLTFEADGIVFVTLGSLDHPETVEMKCHTYVRFKLPEVVIDDGLPQYPGPVGGKGGRVTT